MDSRWTIVWLWSWLWRGVLLVLIELLYWPAFILVLLGYGVRFVLLLPVYLLAVILATIEWLQMLLTIAKFNLIWWNDDATRRANLDLLEERYSIKNEERISKRTGRGSR